MTPREKYERYKKEWNDAIERCVALNDEIDELKLKIKEKSEELEQARLERRFFRDEYDSALKQYENSLNE